MADDFAKETEAIKAVLDAVEPLQPEVRASVLSYVIRRLQIAVKGVRQDEAGFVAGAELSKVTTEGASAQLVHIRDLKNEKRPHSASEMAALVAYYLAHAASENDRKDRITTKDIDTYFKIAEFKLPEKIQFTLPNAKQAGYLDAVGNGEYKLNAVGYNLIVHSLPRDKGTATTTKKRSGKNRRRPR